METKISVDEISRTIKDRIDNFESNIDMIIINSDMSLRKAVEKNTSIVIDNTCGGIIYGNHNIKEEIRELQQDIGIKRYNIEIGKIKVIDEPHFRGLEFGKKKRRW